MQFLRKFVVFIMSSLLLLLLPLTAAAWTARYTVLDREVVKSWVKDSNVYDDFVDEISNLASSEQAGQPPSETADTANLDIAIITKAAKTAFPPEVLEENVEVVLDGAYDWLEGKDATLHFELDLTEEKNAFVAALGNDALTRAVSLPECAPGQVPSGDITSVSCIPPGFDIAAEVERYQQELGGDPGFLPDTTLSEQDIKIDTDGGEQKPISEAFEEAPAIYQALDRAAPILTAVTAFGSLLIFLLASSKRGGLKVLAWLYGLSGVGSLVLALFGKLADKNIGLESISPSIEESGIAEAILVPLIRQVNASLTEWNMIFGCIYLGITFLFLLIVLVTRLRKRPVDHSPPPDLLPTPASRATPGAAASQQPKRVIPEPTEVKNAPVLPPKGKKK